jgi:hypothetical protein
MADSGEQRESWLAAGGGQTGGRPPGSSGPREGQLAAGGGPRGEKSAPGPCRRCLLYESSDRELSRTVYEYIASLPDDIKAPSDVCARRLELCRQCNWLANGICGACGCFAEARAARRDARCAWDSGRWPTA